MNSIQRERIINRHRDSLLRYGKTPQALYWSTAEIQFRRFDVLCGLLPLNAGDKLLDVGCGFADFNAYIQKKDIFLEYSGVDISPDILEIAVNRYLKSKFFCGDIFDVLDSDVRYDWVISSGALSEQLNDQGAYAKRVMKQMFTLCRKGAAFNLLNAHHEPTVSKNDLQSFFPEDVLDYCSSWTADIEMKLDYLDNDFTIFLKK